MADDVPEARSGARPPLSRPHGTAGGRVWIGLALLLASACAFALHNNFARLLYDEGVSATTIAAARTWAIMLLLGLLFGRRGGWPGVPRAAWLTFALTAVCYAAQNPLFLFSFQFIPVSLAIVILYVFPILVAFMAAAMGQERLSVIVLIVAAIAFAGVALVTIRGDAALDWRGVALAGLAALTLAGNVVGAAQLNRHMSALAVPQTLSLVGVTVFTAMMLLDGGPTFPTSVAGWGLFLGAIVTSPAAIITFYLALPYAGAARTSLAMNIEPVITVFLAALILGEMLAPFQFVGAALIVGAVVAMALQQVRTRRAAKR